MLSILGPLGSGKTTLIRALMQDGLGQPGRVLLVVNDVGQVNIDAERLQNVGELRALTAGCIGCSDLGAFVSVIEEAKSAGIEHLLVEPTGIADGREIRDAAATVGIPFVAVTLIDVQHFDRNRALGVMETQLAVADMIGFTWYEDELGAKVNPTSTELDRYTSYCGHSAPGKPMFMTPRGGDGQEQFLSQLRTAYLSEGVVPSLDCHSGCDHDHHGHNHDHGHSHNHGTYAESGSLPPSYSRATLTEVIANLGEKLVRAKGVVEGVEFDFTQGTLRWGDPSPQEPYGTFIATAPIGLFEKAEIAGTKKQLMRHGDVPIEATIAALQWQLGEYPANVSPQGALRVDCEADIIRQLCERPAVPENIRSQAIRQYCGWRLNSLHLMNANFSAWSDHPDFHYWQRRLGCVLGWHIVHCPNELGSEFVSDALEAGALSHALSGLLNLQELSFLEEKAEERPELVSDVLRLGLQHGEISSEEARGVLVRGISLSQGNPEWHRRWLNATNGLIPA